MIQFKTCSIKIRSQTVQSKITKKKMRINNADSACEEFLKSKFG